MSETAAQPATVWVLNMTVWVLNIEHKHGNIMSAHTTERGAELSLVEYVDEWWDQEIGEDVEKPEDATQRVGAYFEFMGDRNEFYSLEELPLETEPVEIISEVQEITDGCDACNDNIDAPDCSVCETSNTGSRAHPHLCDDCDPNL